MTCNREMEWSAMAIGTLAGKDRAESFKIMTNDLPGINQAMCSFEVFAHCGISLGKGVVG